MNFNRIILVVFVFFLSLNLQAKDLMHIQLKPEAGLMTQTIQKAINSCAEKGGGVVTFSQGTFLCGGIELKSKVTLQFEIGAILQGSDKYADYKNDAFIFGKDLSDVAIQGEGIIDGVDCYNPNGEEGFRGPHCIRLIGCKNINFRDITIKNSANWAINCRLCSYGTVDHVFIRAGHDGLHTRFCDHFKVTNCDFRTGDDAFAGNDNSDFSISDCQINTSCNAFRFGCFNLIVRKCHVWGPGEYAHKIEGKANMPSVFVHFSPKDENPKMISGNWLIEDLEIENADQFYLYNFKDGLWQTGQPITNVQFKRIKATGILAAFNIQGDSDLKFNLKVENSSFSFREGTDYTGGDFEGAILPSPALFYASSFNQIRLRNVTFAKKGAAPIMNCNSGNSLVLENVKFENGSSAVPYIIDNVKEVKK